MWCIRAAVVLVRLQSFVASCKLLLGALLDDGREISGQLIGLYEKQDKIGDILRTHAGGVCVRQILVQAFH